MGRFFTVLLLASVLGGGTLWYFGLVNFTPTPPIPDPTPDSEVHLKLGERLYPPKPLEKLLDDAVLHGSNAQTIAGTLQAYDKMDAAPQVPGQILFIGQEIPEGVAQVGGVGPLLQGKVQAALVDVGDSSHYKFYTRLSEGDVIEQNEMVGLINPAKAIHGVREKLTKLAAAEAEEFSAKKIYNEAERRLAVDQRLFEAKVIAEKELSDSKLTTVKTWGDYMGKLQAANVARIDVTKDKLVLSQHYVCNKLPVKSSVIKSVYKRTGEAVKELEPMVHLYAVDRYTAEGLVEMQFKHLLELGKKVTVEPTGETSPLRVWRAHKKEITAVAPAYLKNERTGAVEQVAASASEDGTVCLWSEKYAGPVGLFSHHAPVRTLACSPAGSPRNLLLAGLSDGAIYVWDLNAYKLGEQAKPLKVLRGQHNDAITALSFSAPVPRRDKASEAPAPYFASGSTDGSIVLWDTTVDNFLLYPFDADHGVKAPHTGQITALHFTPQATLVSAARDDTLRFWKLFDKGAEMVGDPIAGRSGKVTALGISRSGSTILFDQDQGKTLQFLTPDGRVIATLQNPGGAVPFETLAEFSPDARMLLTAGAAEGRLQLWQAPTSGHRGFELRQFVTSERGNVTSAAFFDANASGDVPFAVSGTKDGIVYLWPLPTEKDVAKHRIQAEVTQISPNVETRQVRIGVQVPNDGQRLNPGQAVTIVIE